MKYKWSPAAAAGLALASLQSIALAQEQISVRELMRLDTVLALRRARHKLQSADNLLSAQAGRDALPNTNNPKLIAIYGVGTKLLAEVKMGSKSLVYLRGQPLPVGLKNNKAGYRLVDIKGSCITLERRNEPQTLCINTQLEDGR